MVWSSQVIFRDWILWITLLRNLVIMVLIICLQLLKTEVKIYNKNISYII